LSFLLPLQPNQRPNWLTPDVILILFLPALVFEGSIKIDARDLLRDAAPLLVLANIGVLSRGLQSRRYLYRSGKNLSRRFHSERKRCIQP